MNIGDVTATRVQQEGRQVAALCWRHAPMLEVLLITSLRTRRWILPKGWPIPGMTLAESAAQEALEEAGIVGEIAAEPIGRYRYLKARSGGISAPLVVEIFPLKVTTQRRKWNEKGLRTSAWLPCEEAAVRVSEVGLKRMLMAFCKQHPAHHADGLVR